MQRTIRTSLALALTPIIAAAAMSLLNGNFLPYYVVVAFGGGIAFYLNARGRADRLKVLGVYVLSVVAVLFVTWVLSTVRFTAS